MKVKSMLAYDLPVIRVNRRLPAVRSSSVAVVEPSPQLLAVLSAANIQTSVPSSQVRRVAAAAHMIAHRCIIMLNYRLCLVAFLLLVLVSPSMMVRRRLVYLVARIAVVCVQGTALDVAAGMCDCSWILMLRVLTILCRSSAHYSPSGV
jgi:hypothetical protein